MLPHKEDGKRLLKLLEQLFEDDDKSTPEDVMVLREPGTPMVFHSCCTWSYNNYGPPMA